MLRLIIRLSLVLTFISAGSMLFMLLRPYDDSALRAFFAESERCPMPCWQGIRPGVTTVDEALDILLYHPWVENVVVSQSYATSGRGFISWAWTGRQPSFVNSVYHGEMLIRDHLIWGIRIHTDVTFGDLWLLLDRPRRGDVVLAGLTISPVRRYTYRAAHRAIYPYPNGAVYALSTLTCPLRQEPFWRASVDLQLFDTSPNLPDNYDLPKWFLNQPVCDAQRSVS